MNTPDTLKRVLMGPGPSDVDPRVLEAMSRPTIGHLDPAFLEVLNLTNYRNVLYVYSRTGKPFDPGFSGVGTSEDANHNPAHLGLGRTVRIGISLEW